MDKYSRLLVHLSTVNGNKKDEDLYPSFVKDISVLESPNEELIKIIKEDLPTLLPAILILSVHEDVCIRTSIVRTFDTFCLILNKSPSVKNESWWKDMEAKLIAQKFSSRLVKMVELNEEPWAEDWAFVTNLIVHDEHVHGTALNCLLKVVETAFKMSKKNDAIMEKAYFCWNKLIDVFSKHPRVVCSQKLVELLVRPLSTTHLSLKCPDLKMQTWRHLMKKIGFSCGNKCKFVMEPFIEFMYLKGEDSLCINYSKSCLEAFAEMVAQKKIYKHYALKVLSAFPACYNSCNEEMEDSLVKIWTGIVDNITDVEKTNRNSYLLEIFTKFHQVLQSGKPGLNSKLMKVFVIKELFNIDNLRFCITSEHSIAIFSDFLKFEDFRNVSFPATVKDLMENFPEENKKPQNNVDLQIWDSLSDIYSSWLGNMNTSPESSRVTVIDTESLSTLLMIPFIYKQWSVAVQKTWYAVLDAVLSSPSGSEYIPQLLEKIQGCIKESQITAALCIEICTHITNKDKAAFKVIMPTLNLASSYLPPKDSKPLLDLLVLLENAVARVPKSELTKFINELMIYGNKYEHPYGLRIKTKISKVQRKLFALKENNEPNKEQESEQAKNQDRSEQGNGCKARSPIMAQSNFLQRLAKAEEKKKKKCPSMASIFGESGGANQGGEVPARDVSDPGRDTLAKEKEREEGSDKEDAPVAEDRQFALVNGRCSPALPEVVTILTPNKAKRAQTKSPEPFLLPKEASKKSPAPKMPPPPTYFEDNAQDFVVVPPKAKTTPLTEHQKEMLSKRRTDIPALYQDLSQDTLTDSQSLKEIIMLKKRDEDAESKTIVDVDEPNIAEVVDLTGAEDVELADKTAVPTEEPAKKDEEDKSSRENDKSDVSSKSIVKSSEGIRTEESFSTDNVCGATEGKTIDSSAEDRGKVDDAVNEPEVTKTNTESKVTDDIKEDTTKDLEIQKESIPNNPEEKLESPQEIIEDTPQFEPVVSLNLTPTKQPGPPTPRNLIRRMTLLDQEDSPDNKKNKFIEEGEEEREKENIIINAKQGMEKTPTNLVKRRSMRKSSGRFSTKKIDDLKEGKAKAKKELTDPLKQIVTEEDQKENKSVGMAEVVEGQKTVLDQINNKTDSPNPSQLVKPLNQPEEPSEIPLNNNENEKTNTDKDVSENLEPIDSGKKLNEIDVLNEIKLHDNQLPIEDKSTEEKSVIIISSEEESNKEVDEVQVEKDAVRAEENDEKTVGVVESKENHDHSTGSEESNPSSVPNKEDGVEQRTAGQSDNDESPSGDVWSMVTPEKKGRRKKNYEKSLSPKFSPKQLRSKRLSLAKPHETPDESKKKMRKSCPPSTEKTDKNTAEKSDSSNNVEDTKSTDEPGDKVSTGEKTQVSTSSPNDSLVSESSQKNNRKRKSQDESSQETEGKKKKIDGTSEEINQDSLLVVKNSIVKPRKKKIIKSNVKHSPNNLEQWLIKSGKTVVKTSIVSQDNLASEPESKIIDENSDIQINVDDSNKLTVEIPASSSSPQNPNIIVIEASPEFNDSGDIHNCTMVDDSSISDSSFCLNISSSEDESVKKSNESSSELPIEALQCNETELPPSTSQESDESIGRRAYRRKRLFKREETPCREGAPSPEDEQFDAKRERLTTPFRPRRRSAQMVKMATGDEEQQEQNVTPVRRRSICAVRLTENWPEGRLEEWVPCMPTPPGHSPSLGILRRKPVLSPLPSPTSSPVPKKKRVSFLDPPVSKGLLYYKGPETIGQIQHADIPPGERPLWRDEEHDLDKPGPSGIFLKKGTMNGGCEGEDELTAIQEFLNSTPDAPWSKAVPPELDLKQVPDLASSSEPLDDLLQRLTTSEEERNHLLKEMKKLAVNKVSDLSGISIVDLNRLCTQFPGVKSLVKVVKEYLEEKTSLAQPPESEKVQNVKTEENAKPIQVEDTKIASISVKESEPKPEAVVKPSTVDKEDEPDLTKDEQIEPKILKDAENELRGSTEEKEDSAMEVEEDKPNVVDEAGEIEIEEVKSMELVSQSVQTEPDSSEKICSVPDPTVHSDYSSANISEMLKDREFRLGLAEHIPRLLSDREFVERLDDTFGELLQERSPFLLRLAAHADYAFIARLCAAIVVVKENPG